MQQHLADDIQLVLVYQDGQAFDRKFGQLAGLFQRLQNALDEITPMTQMRGIETETFGGLTADNSRFHFTIERFDAAMGLDGFASIFANPFMMNTKADLVSAIQSHQRAILITVGAGGAPGFATALASSGLASALSGGDLPFDISQEAYEERLLLAQTLGKLLIAEQAPTVVHWGQSQQAFAPDNFVALADQGFCLPLYICPFLYGGEEMLDGSILAGVRGLGSQYLLGKMVVFRPSPDNWFDSYKMILSFVAYCRSIGRLLGPDETMSSDEEGAKVIRVSHKNDIPQLPGGYVELHVDPVSQPGSPDRMQVTADHAKLEDAYLGKRNALSEGGQSQPVLHPADVQSIAAQQAPDADTDWIGDTIAARPRQSNVMARWFRTLVLRAGFAGLVLIGGLVVAQGGLLEAIIFGDTVPTAQTSLFGGSDEQASSECRLPPPAKCSGLN